MKEESNVGVETLLLEGEAGGDQLARELTLGCARKSVGAIQTELGAIVLSVAIAPLEQSQCGAQLNHALEDPHQYFTQTWSPAAREVKAVAPSVPAARAAVSELAL